MLKIVHIHTGLLAVSYYLMFGATEYEKQNLYLVYRRFKRGPDIFDTKNFNLADFSSLSPCAINWLLRIVESGSALATNLGFPYSFNKLTTCHE